MATTTKRTRFSRRLPDHVTDELVTVLSEKKVFGFNDLFERRKALESASSESSERPVPGFRRGFFFYPARAFAGTPSLVPPPMPYDYLPVLFQVLIAIGFAAVTLTLSVVFGRSGKTNKTKDSAYECGMLPIGEGAPRFSVKFYLVAMLFVIFDIEVVFMYPWAVQFRDLVKEGPTALVSMAGFAGVLVFAYVYALKKGALNWKS